jgi:uncharacterized protein (TIGR02217 family)
MPAEFHEVRIKDNYSFGSKTGPGFSTRVFQRDSGFNSRLARWEYSQRKFSISYSIRSLDDIAYLQRFYLCRGGPLFGFRLKHLDDYTTAQNGRNAPTALDQQIRPIGMSGQYYQIEKAYLDDQGFIRYRPITKPVGGTVLVAFDGIVQVSGFTVDTTQGLINFSSPVDPEIIVTCGCVFDVPVRFAENFTMSASIDSFESGSVNVELVELIAENLNKNYVTPFPNTNDETGGIV